MFKYQLFTNIREQKSTYRCCIYVFFIVIDFVELYFFDNHIDINALN